MDFSNSKNVNINGFTYASPEETILKVIGPLTKNVQVTNSKLDSRQVKLAQNVNKETVVF